MKFDLVRPCAACPFRADRPFYLTPERAREIVTALRSDQTFVCHKTVDYPDSEAAGRAYDPWEQHCAGASILLERESRPNQVMRIAERLGLYDQRKLDMESPVYADFEEFLSEMEELWAERPKARPRRAKSKSAPRRARP